MILGLAIAALLLSGCETARVHQDPADFSREPAIRSAAAEQEPRSVRASESATPSPETPNSVTLNIQADAEAELGPETAAALPAAPAVSPAPVDPGANRLVSELLARLGNRARNAKSHTVIGLSQLRNQSRCTASEFRGLVERLAELLTAAGRADDVRFTSDPDADTQYELLGTAYLVTAAGFDQWELYLTASPTDEARAIWRLSEPVRVLRSPRSGAQQIFISE